MNLIGTSGMDWASSGEVLCDVLLFQDMLLFELYGREANVKLVAKELFPLHNVGPQKCLAFSVDGSRLATGGVDEKIELCRFSKDGTKPFLFCTVQKAEEAPAIKPEMGGRLDLARGSGTAQPLDHDAVRP
ncbi:hypothetical protein RJ639_023605 [Escallonia herrerae]|uniref:Uncharacterized protein n=1 Tax=Escallonia herrerae TaxID=1293975 RepID=A0AA89ACW6_9ASTE|nr:hypothetical protein RJ639_023605 [Escallonia herrerae]